MKSFEFSDAFLSAIPLEVSPSYKAVYLFIVLFRGCTRNDIGQGLLFDDRLVGLVLEDLLKRQLIRSVRGRLHLEKKEPELPLVEVFGFDEKLPSWYGGN